MRFLSPKVHGFLDYLYVIVLAVAPQMLHLTGLASTLSHILAGAVLVLSLLTRYPFGLIKAIPFPIHGGIELVAAIAMIAAPWLFKFSTVPAARNYYLTLGIVLALVWLTTNYRATLPAETRRAQEREKAGAR